MEVWEKSETVDPEVRAYVYSLVTALGGRSTLDETYAIGDDAIAVLKDLRRWIVLYDNKINRHDVKRCLAEANIVKGDLLEILAQWPENATENKFRTKLALGVLELLVPLTWPLELLHREDKTVNFHRHVPYLQLAQVGYKRAIMHFDGASILRTIVRIGLPSMATTRRERTRRDEGIVRLVLYLFRNLAMITQPQHLPSQGDENEITRSATIDAFHQQDILNLLLTVGSGANDEFQEHGVVMLEILFNLVKGVDPKKLFMQKEQVSKTETQEFKDLLSKEKAMLNSYKKHAPTRHNRFGTMVWVKRDDTKYTTVTGQHAITNEDQTLYQMDQSKKWNKPKYRGKQAQDASEHADTGLRAELTDAARKHLRSFVEDFLDSSFNPLFTCLRKAIEREDDGVTDDHIQQFFYLISWFLDAESARRGKNTKQRAAKAARMAQNDAEDNTYAYIAAVLDQETFVLLNRHMQRSFDDKNWQVLQATLRAFTQVLLTVQDMAGSKDEEDQEIAENIQNRIFYEEATHDRIVQILRGYTHQGFAYLDAVTDCTHVFVRMLERYSKTNVDLQVRSKRRARKKQRQQTTSNDTNGNAENNEDDEQDERDAHQTVSERKFDFARFSAKFMTQPCVDTFLALLHLYAELSPAQLKRCHRYFYRLAFKNEMALLLFRVDILLLFQRLIKGPEGLNPKSEGFKEWEQLVQQVFRRCIKWVEKDTEGAGWKEMCVVEMLFSKVSNTVFYLENGYDRVVTKRPPRPPKELDFRPGVEEGDKIGVMVGALLEQNKAEAVTWVREELKRAGDEKEAWEQSDAARGEDASPLAIYLQPGTDEERKIALFKDKHLRLFLQTLGYERVGEPEDTDASYILSDPAIDSARIKALLGEIQKAEFDPPTFEDGKSSLDQLRDKPAYKPPKNSRGDDIEGLSDLDDIEEPLFPPNAKEKRRQPSSGSDNDSDDDKPKKKRRLQRRKGGDDGSNEEADQWAALRREQARRERENEKNAKFKSKEFISAADDASDEEGDAEFFRLEEERRRKVEGVIGALANKKVGKGKAGGESKKERKGTKGRKREADDEDEDMSASDDAESATAASSTRKTKKTSPRPRRSAEVVDISSAASSSSEEEDASHTASEPEADAEGEDEDQDTPSTSPAILAEISGNAAQAAPTPAESSKADDAMDVDVNGTGDGDEDEDMPVVKRPPARRVRAGFVLDDSSDED